MFEHIPSHFRAIILAVTTSSLLLACTNTEAAILDFNYNTTQLATSDAAGQGALLSLGSSGFISQSYGDISSLLDVSYRYIDTSNQAAGSLQTWPTGYDELLFAAWRGSQSGGDRAQVELASLNGSIVTLNSFNLGSWASSSGKQETVRVFELGNSTPIYEVTEIIGLNNQSNLFSFSGLTSASGFLIDWTSPWWTAISNVDYNVSAVPLPASAWLFASALAGLSLRRHSR